MSPDLATIRLCYLALVRHTDLGRLLQYGGVYLDIDTFIIRSFAAASLYMYDSVLGMEARGLTFLRGAKSDDEMNPKGLCNAIIVSRPGATFLRRWLESYDKFDETQWTEHSVVSGDHTPSRRVFG